jgi:hypothetical protein
MDTLTDYGQCGTENSMPTLTAEQAHLLAADRHLRQAGYLIAAQEVRVAESRASGQDSRLSEELLRAMHQTLRNFIVHRQAICDAIEAERRSLDSPLRPSRHVATSLTLHIDRAQRRKRRVLIRVSCGSGFPLAPRLLNAAFAATPYPSRKTDATGGLH